MSDWIMLVPSYVFSRIKSGFSAKIKEQYGMTDVHFSTVGRSRTEPKFPFVYLKMLPSSETGQDLEGDSINAAMFSFQVETTDNQSQSRARQVMGEVVRIMKEMRFGVVGIPELEVTEDGTHRCIARFRRVIGSGDIL